MINFALKTGDSSSKETKALVLAASLYPVHFNIKYFSKIENVPEDYVVAGNIDWVQSRLGKIVPNYYPEFAKDYLRRRVWQSDTWENTESVFIKPADKPKRFDARLTVKGSYRGKKKGPYWCSEIISFGNEWRLYVINGRIVYSGWYYPEKSRDVDCPEAYINEIQKIIPEFWCGCIDIGETDQGLTLVEIGDAYSVGWYGRLSEGSIYADFLSEGWKFMRKNNNEIS